MERPHGQYRSACVVVAVAAAFAIPTTAVGSHRRRPLRQRQPWHRRGTRSRRRLSPVGWAPSVVWTGHRIIVWGGVSGTYGKEARRDGAIYNPVTDRWHRIRSAPTGVIGGGGHAAAWTGSAPSSGPGTPSKARRAAPSTTRGPTAGGSCRADRSALARDTSPRGPGSELVVIGGSSGDGLVHPIAAAVDPEDPNLAPAARAQPHGRTARERRRLVGRPAVRGGVRLRLFALPVHAQPDLPRVRHGDRCRRADRPLERPVAVDHAGRVDGDGGARHGAGPGDRRPLRPRDRTWRTGAPAPCAMDPGGYEQSAWLDGRYVTACGRDALQVYDVASDTWRTIQAGSSPLNHREGSAIVWTGTDLIVWSGTVRRAGNPTPNSGKSIRLGP